jgi:parallel beta-helix repeat protein
VVGFSTAGIFSNGWENHASNITIFHSDNIIFDNNIVASQLGQYPWRLEINGSGRIDSLASGVLSENSRCVSITRNTLSNLFVGIAVGGDQTEGNGTSFLISDNLIDNFGGDGIDMYGSKILISNNRIINSHNICEYLCIHTDGIQGWNYHGQVGIVNTDIEITSNQIIDVLDKKLALPPSDLHGITIFDGNWNRVLIDNNVVISKTWHGITIYGTDNTIIANNTVLSDSPDRPAWIMVAGKKGDLENKSYGFTVRNNISSAVIAGQVGKPSVSAVIDHNFIIGSQRDIFVKFDPSEANYDLHLKEPVSHRLVGSPLLSPALDKEGHRRGFPVYDGAFAPTTPMR